MPLLSLEPCVFPYDLLADPTRSDLPGERWWVLHTRPRAEKSLARRLYAQELGFFLPLFERQWRSRGRRLSSHLPLFPGYVFLHGDEQARHRALETNLVANCLSVADQVQLQLDLVHVHHLIQTGSILTPETRLRPGTPVEITCGPLAGFEGKVLRSGGQMRLLVEVQFLQQGVSVEIESWMIQPLERLGAQSRAQAMMAG